MLIRYYDHACFSVESAGGTLVAFDPYDDHVGYPLPRLHPDVVLVSHGHMDHANTALFPQARHIIRSRGVHTPMKDVHVEGFLSYHDDVNGAKRGENIIFKLTMDDLRIVHLGDLGHALTEEDRAKIGKVDVLFLPIGGFYTIDAIQAREVIQKLAPQVTIPMHYKTAANPASPMAQADDFYALLGIKPQPTRILRVTREDISCIPELVAMERADA